MWGTVAKLATFGLVAGCGLAVSGLLDPNDPAAGGPDGSTPYPGLLDATGAVTTPGSDGGTAGPEDAGAPEDDAPSSADASVPDDAADASEGGACPSPSADAAVSLVAPIAPAPTIDGDLTDWGCGPWTALTQTNAAYAMQNGQSVSAQFAVRWDAANFYFAAHVAVPLVRGDDGTNPYNNDAVEIYLSAPPVNGDYDATTHQYIVDWKNLAVDYGPVHSPPNRPAPSPPHFTSQTKKVADGWQVEVAIGWPAVMKKPASGAAVAFDVQLDDGDGTALDTRVIETLAPHSAACGCKSCCCGQANDFPNCDTLTFVTVTLE